MVVDLAPLAGVKRSGIYALSVPCMKEPKIIKVGKAKDLRARIDQYQLYYPFGVAVELLWIFPKNTRDVDLKLQQMERAVHEQLSPVLRLPLSRSRTTLSVGVGPWCEQDSTVHERRAPSSVSLFAARLITSGKGEQYSRRCSARESGP